jgi:hypothetical protein
LDFKRTAQPARLPDSKGMKQEEMKAYCNSHEADERVGMRLVLDFV